MDLETHCVQIDGTTEKNITQLSWTRKNQKMIFKNFTTFLKHKEKKKKNQEKTFKVNLIFSSHRLLLFFFVILHFFINKLEKENAAIFFSDLISENKKCRAPSWIKSRSFVHVFEINCPVVIVHFHIIRWEYSKLCISKALYIKI